MSKYCIGPVGILFILVKLLLWHYWFIKGSQQRSPTVHLILIKSVNTIGTQNKQNESTTTLPPPKKKEEKKKKSTIRFQPSKLSIQYDVFSFTLSKRRRQEKKETPTREPDRMAEWVECPSPVLGDQRFMPHGFEHCSSQTNDLKMLYFSLPSLVLGITRIGR